MFLRPLNTFKEYERWESILPWEVEDEIHCRRLMHILVCKRGDGWIHEEVFWTALDRQAYKLALVLGDYETLGWN